MTASCILIVLAAFPLMVYAMVLERVNARLMSENERLRTSLARRDDAPAHKVR